MTTKDSDMSQQEIQQEIRMLRYTLENTIQPVTKFSSQDKEILWLRHHLFNVIGMFEMNATDEFAPGVAPSEEPDYLAALASLPRMPPDPVEDFDDEGGRITRTHWCWSNRDEDGPFHFVATREEALRAALAAAPKSGRAYGTGHAYLMIGKAKLADPLAKKVSERPRYNSYPDNPLVTIYERTRIPVVRARFELSLIEPNGSAKEI